MEMHDLTPLYVSEHWGSWNVLIRQSIVQDWNEWLELWKKALNKYWVYNDSSRSVW